MRKNISIYFKLIVVVFAFAYSSCIAPVALQKSDVPAVPDSFNGQTDSANAAQIKWKDFFSDKNLVSLIDTALKNNPDVAIALQDIAIARNNVSAKKGLLFPNVSAGVGMGVDKAARYTSEGAGNASTDMTPGKPVADPLGDFAIGFQASWEADIWGKLHNAKKVAYTKYLSSVEGKNWVTTNLVAEVANSYYELLALDNKLSIIRQAILLQQSELEIVKIQKQAAVVTDLAVKQFEAQLYNSQSMEFDVLQQINETENNINFLLGRYPQKIIRDITSLVLLTPQAIQTGVPVQLISNRPDIKQAELELLAAKLDVSIARAEFYPSLGLNAGLGFRAFKPSLLFTAPESIAFSLAGDLAAPILNRNAIKAEYNNAKAYQLEAIYEYRKSVLEAYTEVANESSNILNLEKLFNAKSKQVVTLNESIDISKELFKSARANYLEVLIAQMESIDAKMELVETRKRQFNAVVNIYKSLGGGWN